MELLITFILGLIMMAATSTSKIMVRDYKNLPALGLTAIDTFIFIMLISEKSLAFAAVYTSARLIGMATSLFMFNKKKEFIQSFEIVVKDKDSYDKMTLMFEKENIIYTGRAINSKDLHDEEVVVYSKSKEKSKKIKTMIPEGSFVRTSETRSIRMV